MNEICQFVGRSHVGLGDCAVCLPYDLDVFGGWSRFWTSAVRLPRRCTVQVNFLD